MTRQRGADRWKHRVELCHPAVEEAGVLPEVCPLRETHKEEQIETNGNGDTAQKPRDTDNRLIPSLCLKHLGQWTGGGGVSLMLSSRTVVSLTYCPMIIKYI